MLSLNSPRLDPALSYGMVDQNGSILWIPQLGHGAGYFRAHVSEYLEIAISQGMVEEQMVCL
jgi:hypothetical protein